MKISYVKQIGAAGKRGNLNEKRGDLNFNPIVTKLSINVGITSLQFELKDVLCGAKKETELSIKLDLCFTG